MGIEAYVVQSTLGLNIAPTLAGIREVAAAYKDLLAQMRAVRDMQNQINRAASGAGDFAANMGKARQAAQETAAAMTQAADAVVRAAQASSGTALVAAPRLLTYDPVRPLAAPGAEPRAYQTPGVVVTPSSSPILALPAPVTGFETQGAPYGPGTAMVPVGTASGGYTGGYGSYQQFRARRGDMSPNLPVPWRAQGAGTGFTMGARSGAQDEPFNESGAPVPLGGNYPARGDWFAGAYGAQMAGNAAGGLVDGSFMAAAGADQLKRALAAQKFTPEQVDAAYAAAVKTQQDVLGTYVGKNLGLIVQLMSLTQDANASIAMLPEMARAQQVFAGLGRNGNAEITAAMQSAELRGVLFENGKFNLPAVSKFLKNMEAITSMSGGRYGPAEVLQVLRSAGISGAMMTDENGFAEIMPFIQSMGAARAGTALRGFSQQFSAGKMSDGAMELLTEMGIIQHPEMARKVGIGQWQLKPGAMGYGDFAMATQHPEQFILERLLPAADQYAAKNYGDHFTKGDEKTRLAIEAAVMQMLASRIPGGMFDSEAVRLAPLIARDVAAFKKQQSGDAYKTVVDGNPLMVLEGYKAAVNALMVTLGNDNMKVSIATMQALTAALNKMSNVFSADPVLGSQLMLVADGLAILAPAVMKLMIAVPAIVAVGKAISWAKTEIPAVAGPTSLLGKVIAPVSEAMAVQQMLQGEFGGTKKDGFYNNPDSIHEGIADMVHSLVNALTGQKQEIVVTLDGKVIARDVVKRIASGASGPLNDRGDQDARVGYTPTEH